MISQLLFILLSSICLYWSFPNHFLLLVTTALVPYVFLNEKFKIYYLIVLSMITFILIPNLYYPPSFYRNHPETLHSLGDKLNFEDIHTSMISIISLSSILIGFIFVKFFQKIFTSFSVKFFSIFYLSIIFIFIFSRTLLDFYLVTKSIFFVFAFLTLITVLKLTWYLLLLFRDGRKNSFQSLLFFIVPFWESNSIGREQLNIKNYLVTKDIRTETVKKGFFLILRACLLLQFNIFILNLYANHILGISDYAHFNELFGKFLRDYASHSILERWVTLYLISWIFYTYTFFVTFDLFIGVANLAGLNLQTSTNQPWKAQSFSDFWGRSTYYMNIIFINYFYLPIRSFLKKINFHFQIKFISLFITIFLGNIAIHLVRDAILMVNFETLNDFLIDYLSQRSVYFIGLPLAIAVSSTYLKVTAIKIPLLLKRFMIWNLYTFLLSSAFIAAVFGVLNIHIFYLSLFGL
jgi:hypothetical protein